MEALNSNLPTILIFLGLGLLVIEVAVLGFAIMVLFFIGIGCLATGLLMMINIIPQTMVGALVGTSLLTVLSAVGLWKPLKKLQNSTEKTPVTSDLVGTRFVLDSEVTQSNPGETKFSGITWKVVADVDIAGGTQVEVVRASVGVLTVRPHE